MTKTLTWVGEVVGGFGATLLAYVIAGGLVGMVLAVDFGDGARCWPHRLQPLLVADCDDPSVQTFWFITVEVPRALLAAPAMPLSRAITAAVPNWYAPPFYVGIDPLAETVGMLLLALLTIVGFFAWRTRSALVAWGLVLALAGEIVAVAMGA